MTQPTNDRQFLLGLGMMVADRDSGLSHDERIIVLRWLRRWIVPDHWKHRIQAYLDQREDKDSMNEKRNTTMILPTKDQTPSPFTLLSQNIHGVVRMAQKPHLTTLQAFTGSGFQAVALDDDALLAFLMALPSDELHRALFAQAAMRPVERLPQEYVAEFQQEVFPVMHWSTRPNLIACGCSDPIISSTARCLDVTCEACLDVWRTRFA